MEYVILAAGQGSRFVREGVTVPKPMVPILGRPMIERLVDVLMQCDGTRIYIATNAAMSELNGHLAFLRDIKELPISIRPIISDNSYYSLQKATEGVPGRFIAMTTDAIFPTSEFMEYVRIVSSADTNEIIMGLTEYIDDESPLYAQLNDSRTEIINYRYGGKPFEGTPIVSAGLYGLTEEAVAHGCRLSYPESLSDFQRILAVGDRYTVKPFVFSKAFDVDCGHDRIEAEKFVMEINGEKSIK